ncbi:MAG: UDP-glucose/GDP-mannose dehydrogenase family protein [Cyclobacteriaceae bacterium]
MRVAVFGLGYVGAVSCACFAKLGHRVIGVDVSQLKVDLINDGKAPIIEKDLENYIEEGRNNGSIQATVNIAEAIINADISLVCVGTPSQLNGSIDLSYIFGVISEIGEQLKRMDQYHAIVIRSTVAPGTIRESAKLIQELSGKIEGEDFDVISNPEFLREGTAIYDFWNPPYTIIGSNSSNAISKMEELYKGIEAPIYNLKPEESEMIKYANNNFHAVKVTFANEIGNICKELGVDGHKVMDIVAKDTKLNLSPYYLKPGFAFGGSCLPKDVRGLNYRANQLDVKTPLLSSLMESNTYQIERGLSIIQSFGKKKIGFLGFSFKADTDDLRESPLVTVIETLIGRGYDLSLYDRNVMLSKLTGKNKSYITGHIPHIAALLKSQIKDVIDQSEVIVIGNQSKEFEKVIEDLPVEKVIVDLVRLNSEKISEKNYVGICW